MNQFPLNDHPAVLPRVSLTKKNLPEVTGGVTLSNLSNSTTVRRLATKREGIRQVYPALSLSSQGSVGANGLTPASDSAIPSKIKISTKSLHEVRKEVGRILDLLLADEYMLYGITRDYHWNVTGPDYYSLRLLFQLQHEKAADWVDDLTELIRELRLDTRIGWDDLKKLTRCSATAGFGLPAENMLSELLRVHDAMIAQLQSDSETCLRLHGDASTAGFLSGVREQHENAAWMLRAQLESSDNQPLGFIAHST